MGETENGDKNQNIVCRESRSEKPEIGDLKVFKNMTEEELLVAKEHNKAIRKARQQASMQRPKIFLTLKDMRSSRVFTKYPDIDDSKVDMDVEYDPLFMSDVQHLILYALVGNKTSCDPRWARILRWTKTSHLVTIVVDDVSITEYNNYADCFEFMKSTFTMCAEVMNPRAYGKDTLTELLNVPMSITQIQSLIRQDDGGAKVIKKRLKRVQQRKAIEEEKRKAKVKAKERRLRMKLECQRYRETIKQIEHELEMERKRANMSRSERLETERELFRESIIDVKMDMVIKRHERLEAERKRFSECIVAVEKQIAMEKQLKVNERCERLEVERQRFKEHLKQVERELAGKQRKAALPRKERLEAERRYFQECLQKATLDIKRGQQSLQNAIKLAERRARLTEGEELDNLNALLPKMDRNVQWDGRMPGESRHFNRLDLMLDVRQMLHERFIFQGVQTSDRFGRIFEDEFVFSSANGYAPVTARSPMFAIDCEMCVTTRRMSEVTRVSVVNEKYECVYDMLVQPDYKIIDYVTRYSGITAEMLKDVTTRLCDVQRDLQRILPTDAILIGQSLCGDLKVLRLYHPYVIDTSVIFNLSGRRVQKSGVKKMAAYFLGKSVQEGDQGHSPIEDSATCLDLVLHKLSKGYLEYGDVTMGWTGGDFEERVVEDDDDDEEEQEEEEESDSDYSSSLENDIEVVPAAADVTRKRKNTSNDDTDEHGSATNKNKKAKLDNNESKSESESESSDDDSDQEIDKKTGESDDDNAKNIKIKRENKKTAESSLIVSNELKRDARSIDTGSNTNAGLKSDKLGTPEAEVDSSIRADTAFTRHVRSLYGQVKYTQRLVEVSTKENRTVHLIGNHEQFSRDSDRFEHVTYTETSCDEQSCDAVEESVGQHFFSLVHLTDYCEEEDIDRKKQFLRSVDYNIKHIMQYIPDKAIVTVVFGGRVEKSRLHNALCLVKVT